ncbi:MAG: hypothetical protein NT055_00425, partial [Nitrospirae bacterium]|nr:hypothetical protein [Nitrospirota bacterium]
MVAYSKNIFNLELRRKSFHIISGLLIVALTYFSEPIFGKLIIVPLLIGSMALLVLQLFRNNPLTKSIAECFEREKKAKILYLGSILYGIGISVPILLLERNLA